MTIYNSHTEASVGPSKFARPFQFFRLEGQPVSWMRKQPQNPANDRVLTAEEITTLERYQYYYSHLDKVYYGQPFKTYQGLCLGIIQPAGVGNDYECAQLMLLDTSTGKVHQVDTDWVTFLNYTGEQQEPKERSSDADSNTPGSRDSR